MRGVAVQIRDPAAVQEEKSDSLELSKLEVVKNMWSTSMETQIINSLRSHLLLTLDKGLVVEAHVKVLGCISLSSKDSL